MQGRQIIAGFKKATTWGTAVACGANNGILLLSEGMTRARENLPDDSLGIDFYQESDLGAITSQFPIEAYLRYWGLDLLLSMLMGTGGAPVQQGVTIAYAYAYTLAYEIEGLFGTLAMERLKDTTIHEATSCKPIGCTIKGAAGKPLTVAFDFLANDVIRNSAINTTTTIDTITYPEIQNRVLFRQGVCRINDQSGIALASGDKVYPSAFELSFKRKAAGELLLGSDSIDEPDENAIPEITLKLDFPRYTSDAMATDWLAGTNQKADLVFTGGLIASTYYNTMSFEFPNLTITDVQEPTSGPGKIPQSVTFRCDEASAAPTGMTATKPLHLSGINEQSTNPLA